MRYIVVRHFRDSQDDRHQYTEGDIFPRDGVSVSEERIKELSSIDNRQHTILIKAVTKDKKTPTRTEISQMNTENLQKLADSVGIENAYETSGRKLKEILIEHFNL